MLFGTMETGNKEATMNMQDLEARYYEITELYDLAEELVDTVESEFVDSPDDQLVLIEELVEEVGDAADILTEEFITLAEAQKKGKKKPRNKGKIESALRRIYSAIDAYNTRVSTGLSELNAGFRNIADPIVNKIKRQMEVVVANFLAFLELSLDRIMHKSQIEELKERQAHIAHLLAQAGPGQA